jgi:predicted phage terminase large subunit-like protein
VTRVGSQSRPPRNLRYFTGSVPTKRFDFSRPSGSLGTATKRLPTFREFIRVCNPLYQFYPYIDRLIDVLERVATGEIKRLMIFMPPRHGKSEAISRLFSAYYLLRFPERFVGINSYAADLAYTLSRSARDNYQRAGGALRQDAYAVSNWLTQSGGGMWAAGVGGPITGRGFHLGIIDDPLKNSEEAQSQTIREKQKDWYSSAFYTRQEPGAAIIVIQTRWHQDDLSGWLLTQEETEQPEGWHIVCFPAIAEPLPAFPSSCTVELDWRQSGEALSPFRYALDRLEKIRRRIGEFFFAALYQQRPFTRTGGLFPRQRFEIVDQAPANLQLIRFWDLAATSEAPGKDPDYTAGALVGLRDGIYCILDMRRLRGEPAEVERLLRQTAALDGRQVPITIEQEGGSSGKIAIDHFLRYVLVGSPARGQTTDGKSKLLRADPVSSAAEAGNIKLVRGSWNGAFLDEAELFPAGAHDDQVDAISGAVNELTMPEVRIR